MRLGNYGHGRQRSISSANREAFWPFVGRKGFNEILVEERYSLFRKYHTPEIVGSQTGHKGGVGKRTFGKL